MNVVGNTLTYSGYWNNTSLNVCGNITMCLGATDQIKVFNFNDNSYTPITIGGMSYDGFTDCTSLTFCSGTVGNPSNVIFYDKSILTSSGVYNTIGGGLGNISYGNYSTIGGGCRNTSSGYYSFIGSGFLNTALCSQSFIGGGLRNTLSGNSSVIGGGEFNTVLSQNSVIGGGRQNTLSGNYSTISGGYLNITLCSQSFIGGGRQNTSSGYRSIIVGGGVNIASGSTSFIGGGYGNVASGDYSFIGGGFYNTASGYNTFVLGSNLIGCSDNTTYVQNLKINNGTEALFTTTNKTLTTGLNSLYVIPTIYDGAFIDYVAKCGANYRAGQMMSTWSGGTIVFNETTTVDIGNTNRIYMCMIISGGSPVFVSSATTSGWCVKSIIKAI